MAATTTFNNFNAGTTSRSTAPTRRGSTHYRLSPLRVSSTSSDTTVIKIDSATVTIDSGAYYNNHAHVTPMGVGTARITFAAAGQTVLDTLNVTVNTPPVTFNFGSSVLGRRQHYDPNGNGFYVQTPDSRSVAVPVTLTQNRAVDTLTTLTPTIPISSNYVYLDAYGLTNGTDTLSVAATGYSSSQAYITVSTPKFVSLRRCRAPRLRPTRRSRSTFTRRTAWGTRTTRWTPSWCRPSPATRRSSSRRSRTSGSSRTRTTRRRR